MSSKDSLTPRRDHQVRRAWGVACSDCHRRPSTTRSGGNQIRASGRPARRSNLGPGASPARRATRSTPTRLQDSSRFLPVAEFRRRLSPAPARPAKWPAPTPSSRPGREHATGVQLFKRVGVEAQPADRKPLCDGIRTPDGFLPGSPSCFAVIGRSHSGPIGFGVPGPNRRGWHSVRRKRGGPCRRLEQGGPEGRLRRPVVLILWREIPFEGTEAVPGCPYSTNQTVAIFPSLTR
jgi:hypothetical protein